MRWLSRQKHLTFKLDNLGSIPRICVNTEGKVQLPQTVLICHDIPVHTHNTHHIYTEKTQRKEKRADSDTV